MRILPRLAAALLATSTVVASAAPKYTYIDLVERLTDLEGLAVLPPAGEKCQQQSSYDRSSRYDAASAKYVNWSANGDAHGIIRKEGDAELLAEMEGPGVIWRIWSAAPRDGNVKVFLDGASEPTINLPFTGFFNGKNAPFVYPSIVNEASRGQNSYLPIPFQKSCRILGEKGWGDFYHFTYTTYPPGTTLPTFARSLQPAEIAALEKADKFLMGRLGADPAGKREGERTELNSLSVPAHGKVTVAKLQGPRAITALKIKFHPDAMGDVQRTLREAVLQIKWDGETQPSVRVPIGDFFGTAPGLNQYKSLPLGISQDNEGYSYWYMPFEKSADVEIIDDGSQSFPLEVSMTHAPLTRSPEELGRFHAKWHLDAFLNREPERAIDWPLLRTQGRGRFCGVMLHVWNPRGGWWGEGDEKFFVDGEKFPSTFGTGSEDYFG